jgi:hypothetical protein
VVLDALTGVDELQGEGYPGRRHPARCEPYRDEHINELGGPVRGDVRGDGCGLSTDDRLASHQWTASSCIARRIQKAAVSGATDQIPSGRIGRGSTQRGQEACNVGVVGLQGLDPGDDRRRPGWAAGHSGAQGSRRRHRAAWRCCPGAGAFRPEGYDFGEPLDCPTY